MSTSGNVGNVNVQINAITDNFRRNMRDVQNQLNNFNNNTRNMQNPTLNLNGNLRENLTEIGNLWRTTFNQFRNSGNLTSGLTSGLQETQQQTQSTSNGLMDMYAGVGLLRQAYVSSRHEIAQFRISAMAGNTAVVGLSTAMAGLRATMVTISAVATHMWTIVGGWVGVAVTAIISIGAMFAVGTKKAVELENSIFLLSRTLGTNSNIVRDWAKKNASNFGMSQREAMTYGTTFAQIMRRISNTSEEAAKKTNEMLEVSAIISKNRGYSMSIVMEKIRSGLMGETEAIDDLGIEVKQNMIKSTQAFRDFAGDKSWNELSTKTQTQILNAAILEQAYKNYGDAAQNANKSFSETSTLTQVGKLKAAWDDLLTNMGRLVRPFFGMFVTGLQMIVRLVSDFVGWLADKFENAIGLNEAFQKAQKIGDEAFKSLTGGSEELNDSMKEIKNLQSFDEIHELSNKATDSIKTQTDAQKQFNDLIKSSSPNTTTNSKKPEDITLIPRINIPTIPPISGGAEAISLLATINSNISSINSNSTIGIRINATNNTQPVFNTINTTELKPKTVTINAIDNTKLTISEINKVTLPKKTVEVEVKDKTDKTTVLGSFGTLNTSLVNMFTTGTSLIYLNFNNLLENTKKLIDENTTFAESWKNLMDRAIKEVNTGLANIKQKLQDFFELNLKPKFKNEWATNFADSWNLVFGKINIDAELGEIKQTIQDFLVMNLGKALQNEYATSLANNFSAMFDPAIVKVNEALKKIKNLIGLSVADSNLQLQSVSSSVNAQAPATSTSGLYGEIGKVTMRPPVSTEEQTAMSKLTSIFSTLYAKFADPVSEIQKMGLNVDKSEIELAHQLSGGMIPSGAIAGSAKGFLSKLRSFKPLQGIIPAMASGGIVNSPTTALIGEAGSEAVIPLTRNNVLVDGIASAVGSAVMSAISVMGQSNNNSNNNNGSKEIIINIDGKQMARALIPNINNENNRIGNVSIIRGY